MPSESYEDAFRNDPTFKRWVRQVLTDMKPKMEESAMVAQIVPDDDEGDVKFWVELGASIMMDKPILAIAFEGKQIPDKLRLIADEIVILPGGADPAAAERVQEAMKRMTDRLEEEGQ